MTRGVARLPATPPARRSRVIAVRILITGAGGNIGRGLTERLLAEGQHQLVLSDVVRPNGLDERVEFHQLDVQIGAGLETAARDCDALVHLPA
ncbi:NAD-dependent epimerase/dehydratase family protein [Microlunatus sp. Gsoil 973]|nr:NAD-dependent epimerase/dehydratase family protein [Microlunatus sp. Gsoil 973]